MGDDFLEYPTGAIGKDEWCDSCKSYNNRRVTCTCLVENEGKVLMVKRAVDPEKGRWSLPGGYLFYGETVEECAKRECEEESGYGVEIVGLLGVYSSPARDADGRQNVDCCIVGSLNGTRGEVDDEVERAEWFDLDDLPEKIAFDHRQMIEDYMRKKSK